MNNSFNATRKGLLTGCVMIALSLFSFYGLKRIPGGTFQYIIYIIFSIGLAWSILDFARATSPETKFAEYFSTGFKTFIAVTLLMIIYTFIFYSLHPELRDTQIEANDKLLIQQGNHTPQEIADNAKQMKSIFMPMMLGITTFLYLFLGSLITTLYTAIIMQKKKR